MSKLKEIRECIVLFLAFCCANAIACFTATPPFEGPLIKPAIGISFGYFYLFGMRRIWVYVLANTIAFTYIGTSFHPQSSLIIIILGSLFISGLYALQLQFALWNTKRIIGNKVKLISFKQISQFIFLSGVVHLLYVPLIGCLLLSFVIREDINWFLNLYLFWYKSDLIGSLLFSTITYICLSKNTHDWSKRCQLVIIPTIIALMLTSAAYLITVHRENQIVYSKFNEQVETLRIEANSELKNLLLYGARFEYIELNSILLGRREKTKVVSSIEELSQTIPWVKDACVAVYVKDSERATYEEWTDRNDSGTALWPINSSKQDQSEFLVPTITTQNSRFRIGDDLIQDDLWRNIFNKAILTKQPVLESATDQADHSNTRIIFPCFSDPSANQLKLIHSFFLVEIDIDKLLESCVNNPHFYAKLAKMSEYNTGTNDDNQRVIDILFNDKPIKISCYKNNYYNFINSPKYSVLIFYSGAILSTFLLIFVLISSGQSLIIHEEVIKQTHELNREMSIRKTIESSLRLSEASLLESQRLAGLGYWEWQPADDCMYWSPILVEMIGVQGSDIRFQFADFAARLHPDDRYATISTINSMSATSSPIDIEFRIQRVDRSFRWFAAVISYSERSIPQCIRGTMLDITERKRAEVALREGEARLRIALHSAKMGTWEWVAGSDQIIWDARQEAIFGFDIGTFDRRIETFLSRIHPDHRNRIALTMKNMKDTYEPFHDEFQIIVVPEQIRWVVGYGHPLHDQHGNAMRYVGVYMDITERKRNEIALRESEARRRLALDAGGMGTMIWDVKSDRMSFDRKLHDLFEIDPDQFSGTLAGFKQCIHPDDVSEVKLRIRELLTDSEVSTVHFEFKINHRAPQPRWLSSHIHAIRDINGRVYRLVGIFFDNTERRLMEESLRANREMLRVAQSIARIGSFVWYPQYSHTVWSEEMYRILSYEPYSIEPTLDAFLSRVHHQDRDMIRRKFEATTLSGEDYCFEFRVVQPNGEIRFIHVQAEICRNSQGEILEFRGVNQDITDRKLFEYQLQESEARLNEAQLIAKAGSWEWNPSTDRVKPSKAMLVLCGFEEGLEYTGQDFFSIIHPDDLPSVQRKIQLAIEEFGELQAEFRTNVHGECRWFSIRARCTKSTSDQIEILGLTQDITDTKREEEQRRKFQESMQQTQRMESLGILAGGVAHDFNNLLTGILGNASLARELLPRDSELHDYLRPIEKSAEHAAELCHQMLVYAGKSASQRGQVELNVLIHESLDLLRLAASRKAKLDFELAEQIPAIEGDAGRIRQILLNLVQNASEALPVTGGKIRIQTGSSAIPFIPNEDAIVSGTIPQGSHVWLEVSDNGAGMPPETLTRIFEPFFTTKFTGRGLGLSAVHGIVRDHNGCLAVTSRIGLGTTFRILLPTSCSEIQLPALCAASDTPRPTNRKNQDRRVALIVDEEPTIRAIAGFSLKSLGFTIEESGDICESMHLIAERGEEFDLVVIDIDTPGTEENQLYHTIRDQHPDLAIIMVSGMATPETIGIKDDPNLGYLAKPFRAIDLTNCVRRQMNSSLYLG